MESRQTFRSKVTDEAWQYKIRKQKEQEWIESGKYQFWNDIDLSLKRARVKEVERKTAEKIILEYEWLGDMAITNKYYGIFFDNFCGGVACINTNGQNCNTHKLYGLSMGEVGYLARGACAYWTPRGSASKLISYAIKLEKLRGAKILVAFADTDAGEYGTVYQAANWICLGKGAEDRQLVSDNGRVYERRTLHSRGIKAADYKKLYKIGWKIQRTNAKYRYCYILADEPEKTRIYNRIKHLITEYPKRPNAAAFENGSDDQLEKGGANPTQPLHLQAING